MPYKSFPTKLETYRCSKPKIYIYQYHDHGAMFSGVTSDGVYGHEDVRGVRGSVRIFHFGTTTHRTYGTPQGRLKSRDWKVKGLGPSSWHLLVNKRWNRCGNTNKAMRTEQAAEGRAGFQLGWRIFYSNCPLHSMRANMWCKLIT